MENKNVLQVLKAGMALVKQSWCSDAIAKHNKNKIVNPCGTIEKMITKNGDEIETFYPATSWSITGAILAAEDSKHLMFTTNAFEYVEQAAKARGFNYSADFEGTKKRTQEECVALFEESIILYKQDRKRKV